MGRRKVISTVTITEKYVRTEKIMRIVQDGKKPKSRAVVKMVKKLLSFLNWFRALGSLIK